MANLVFFLFFVLSGALFARNELLVSDPIFRGSTALFFAWSIALPVFLHLWWRVAKPLGFTTPSDVGRSSLCIAGLASCYAAMFAGAYVDPSWRTAGITIASIATTLLAILAAGLWYVHRPAHIRDRCGA